MLDILLDVSVVDKSYHLTAIIYLSEGKNHYRVLYGLYVRITEVNPHLKF